MTIGTRLFTVEDLATFPENGDRYEVIGGELYVSHTPHAEHQEVVGEASFALRAWRKLDGAGWVISGGVIFSRHDGVIPDLMWFSDDRLQQAMINPTTGEWDGHFYAAPGLAIEVLSPGVVNESRDREVKLTLYSRRGVREYWIIDRFTRSIAIYRRIAHAALDLGATLTDQDNLSSPLLPGFSLSVAQLFQLPEALRR
jgi:Uma2 family endonuclease